MQKADVGQRHAPIFCVPHIDPSLLPRQDALSKTIPIWAAVLNRAVAICRNEADAKHGAIPLQDLATLPKLCATELWDTRLHLPPWVPAGEAMQIENLLDGWAAELLQVSRLFQQVSVCLKKEEAGRSFVIVAVCHPFR